MIMFGFFHRKQPADSNDGVSLQISDGQKNGRCTKIWYTARNYCFINTFTLRSTCVKRCVRQ